MYLYYILVLWESKLVINHILSVNIFLYFSFNFDIVLTSGSCDFMNRQSVDKNILKVMDAMIFETLFIKFSGLPSINIVAWIIVRAIYENDQ